MYGLIGRIIAAEGSRGKLITVLAEGTKNMPGCVSYVVAKDSSDSRSIWVTEVWRSKEDHQASLKDPAVLEAISKGRPFIADFGERFETEPLSVHKA